MKEKKVPTHCSVLARNSQLVSSGSSWEFAFAMQAHASDTSYNGSGDWGTGKSPGKRLGFRPLKSQKQHTVLTQN